MDKSNSPTCYICENQATSHEHVPPKCFFPEKKDVGESVDYRKQLITVPSCDLHNTAKSKDDEYLLFVISSHAANKNIAQTHFGTKVKRGFHRNPHKLDVFLKNVFPILINGEESIGYEVDRDRFDNGIRHIASALYFHECQLKWNKPMVVITPHLFEVQGENSEATNQRMQQFDAMMVDLLINEPVNGANPDIFEYQFRLWQDRFAVRMVFYKGFTVIAYSSPVASVLLDRS